MVDLNVNKTYYSFQDLAKDYGCKPVKKRTNDMDKLKAQQERFAGRCKVCNHILTYHNGTNVLTCTNPECKGIKMTSKNEDGTEKIWFIPVTRMVDTTGMEIAMNLFA